MLKNVFVLGTVNWVIYCDDETKEMRAKSEVTLKQKEIIGEDATVC